MTIEVDFIGRWIEAAPDAHLEEKIAEYSLETLISPRDAEMRVRLKLRCQNELAKRRLRDQKGDATSS